MNSLTLDIKPTACRKKEPIYYIEVLRVIACLAVVMIHTAGDFVVSNFCSLDFWIGNVLDSLCRFGVPIFVMISGVLILDESFEFSLFKMKKYIMRLVRIFVFWSAIYCVVFDIVAPVLLRKSITFSGVLYSFLNGPFHFWYLFMIIGIYLVAPFLKLFVKKENKKIIEYFLALAFVFSFLIPQIIEIGATYSEFFKALNNTFMYFNMGFVGSYVAYFVLGWYLHNFGIANKKLIYTLGLVGFAITAVGTFVLSYTTGISVRMYDTAYVNVLMQTVALFEFVKNTATSRSENLKIAKFVSAVSKNSLGIYIIHAAICRVTAELLKTVDLSALFVIPIQYIVACIGAFLATSVISKISFLKKFV